MKMKRIMKSTRGEGYIDLAVAVLVLVFVLVIAISLWSAITLKQDMRGTDRHSNLYRKSRGGSGAAICGTLRGNGHHTNGHLEHDLL